MAPSVFAQEVLHHSIIKAKAFRKKPALGLPQRRDGQMDPAVWYENAGWHGAVSVRALPFWSMAPSAMLYPFADLATPAMLAPSAMLASSAELASSAKPASSAMLARTSELKAVSNLCYEWEAEKPHKAPDVVWGPYRGGWYIALCKRVRGGLGWKSIAFVFPPEGIAPDRSIYAYSHSVNWLEARTGYNLFPKLPAHLQEIIEEMTAVELLCPIQEFDRGELEQAEFEIEHDWEEDIRDR